MRRNVGAVSAVRQPLLGIEAAFRIPSELQFHSIVNPIKQLEAFFDCRSGFENRNVDVSSGLYQSQ
jgi:hypothetical protein